ncbi:hypothetical protein SDRG_02684 [Saprolegnia diclina VS20]|uniref:PDZ domain-containing protein n=1 Tax=Saprolegnia diclina (strain VS20) TaxID=1156394 RepID=T0R159_SAPDV|nr:hypothetical protein SDRG_02684 [Saprolegnia diclina VS20]EQC40025.1 hypothetical protein SDRG_02684 [Saprolegnia diclina VS20]|eukprot:XP_008606499.1 hypothetical protein SDRG_02684 [Saprolegnia diclina VS20]
MTRLSNLFDYGKRRAPLGDLPPAPVIDPKAQVEPNESAKRHPALENALLLRTSISIASTTSTDSARSNMAYITYMAKWNDKSLGLLIKNRRNKSIVKGKTEAADAKCNPDLRQIQHGDELIGINEHSTIDIGFEATMALLKNIVKPAILSFRRQIREVHSNNDDSFTSNAASLRLSDVPMPVASVEYDATPPPPTPPVATSVSVPSNATTLPSKFRSGPEVPPSTAADFIDTAPPMTRTKFNGIDVVPEPYWSDGLRDDYDDDDDGSRDSLFDYDPQQYAMISSNRSSLMPLSTRRATQVKTGESVVPMLMSSRSYDADDDAGVCKSEFIPLSMDHRDGAHVFTLVQWYGEPLGIALHKNSANQLAVLFCTGEGIAAAVNCISVGDVLVSIAEVPMKRFTLPACIDFLQAAQKPVSLLFQRLEHIIADGCAKPAVAQPSRCDLAACIENNKLLLRQEGPSEVTIEWDGDDVWGLQFKHYYVQMATVLVVSKATKLRNVRAGDRLVAINGVPVDEIGVFVAMQQLLARTPTHLTFQCHDRDWMV